MSDFIATGRVFDLVLALVAAECALLLLFRLRRGRHLLPPDVLAHLAAALGLLAATQAALAHAWPGYTALWLLGALCAHVYALRIAAGTTDPLSTTTQG